MRQLLVRRGRWVIGAAVVAIVGGLVMGAARTNHDRLRPVDVARQSLDAEAHRQAALNVKRVVVPDLVGQPLSKAEAFVASVPRARLSVGGRGPVILYQQPPAGGWLSDDGAYLAVTLGDIDGLEAVRHSDGDTAEGGRQAASAEYPRPTHVTTLTPTTAGSNHQVRNPDDVAVKPPASYQSMVVVITYKTAAPRGSDWTWKLIDAKTATVVGSYAVRPGDRCAMSDRQSLAARLATPARPDDEFTVRLERRVGSYDEMVAATTVAAASNYRGGGVELIDNAGKLAANPTGDNRC